MQQNSSSVPNLLVLGTIRNPAWYPGEGPACSVRAVQATSQNNVLWLKNLICQCLLLKDMDPPVPVPRLRSSFFCLCLYSKSKGFAARRGLGARHDPEHGGSFFLPGADADNRGGGLGEEEGQERQDGGRRRGHEPRFPGCHGDP